MEQWHHLYELPYDEARPLICCDEHPCQLIGNTLQPIAMKPGKEMRENYEYQCYGTCSLFFAIEPLTERRILEIRERCKKIGSFYENISLEPSKGSTNCGGPRQSEYPYARFLIIVTENWKHSIKFMVNVL